MEENITCWLSQLRDYFEVQSEDATNLKVVCKLLYAKGKIYQTLQYLAGLLLQQTYTFDTICYVHLRNCT